MKITHESSTLEFQRLLKRKKNLERVPLKPLRRDLYLLKNKTPVALVRTDNRKIGIEAAFDLIGGSKPLIEGVNGEIIIKPNCNHDMPFPRNSHPDTVKNIAKNLISEGLNPRNIVIGDMSGMYRGLPTKFTMENLGMTKVADELGLEIACFEEEEWVLVEDTGNGAWPDGITIPRRVYDADRLIMTPILRPHTSVTFSMSIKLAVGLMDPKGREWLHNGEHIYEKLLGFNLAISSDLTLIDGLRCYVDKGPNFSKMVKPGVIIIGSNRVAVDTIAVGVLKYYQAHGMEKKPIKNHTQFRLAEKLNLGSPELKHIDLRTKNLTEDSKFDDILDKIKEDLTS
jgi:uncharacterized protein (DUF362 family)